MNSGAQSKEGEIVLKPYASFVAKSPEELAQLGVSMYPPALDKIWGDDAGTRYQVARGYKPYSPPSDKPGVPQNNT